MFSRVITCNYHHSQSLPESSGDEKESSEGNESVAAPTPHESSAEMRETCGQTGTWLLVREGGREMGRATVPIQLDRAES